MTQPFKVRLFGCPVGHSVSPDMHHAAADALGIHLEYATQQVSAGQLPDAVCELRGAEFLGANITLPHKTAMVGLVDSVSPLAKRIGAVNTVYKVGSRLVGDNTDAPAVVRCLRESLGFRPEADRVVLLGAGGASRAVAVGLVDAGVRSLAVWNRTERRGRRLLDELAALSPGAGATLTAVTDLDAALAQCTLLVNATSIGLDTVSAPVSAAALAPTARVFDLVYGPDATPLVRQARSLGMLAEDGLWMLVFQAASAFALWTGTNPPAAVMYDAALRALRDRAATSPADRFSHRPIE